MTARKPKAVKPVKMWASLGEDAILSKSALYNERKDAVAWSKGGRKMGYRYQTIPVLVTPIKPSRKVKRG